MANLMGGDIFIDCLDRSGTAFVAAHAQPDVFASSYSETISGMPAFFHNEPMVYHAFAEGIPFHGCRANTQENKTVSQDVLPIKMANGNVIGVLIAEHDISREVAMERKIDAFENAWMGAVNPLDPTAPEQLMVREAHHRIKNNLQLISSLCSLKELEAQTAESKALMRDVSGMVMSVSQMHNLLSDSADQLPHKIFLPALLSKLIDSLNTFQLFGKPVEIILQCENVMVNSDSAIYILLVVNELITNAVKHGRPSSNGKVKVELINGIRFSTIIITDNGGGFAAETTPGKGLSIALDIVRDRLKGDLNLVSDDKGTKAYFNFSNGVTQS
jgi:two-component sensor histidine kinase